MKGENEVDKVKKIISAILQMILKFFMLRKNIGVRFVFAVLYMGISAVVNLAVMILAVFQFVFLFITTRHSEAIKTLSHKLVVYLYKASRYFTLNENSKPYPFGSFPDELEPADDTDLTNPLPEKEEDPDAHKTVWSADPPTADNSDPFASSNEENPSSEA
jgi:hypothetical protein